MTQDDLETVYEAMAEAIDAEAPAARELFLARLALALADSLGDPAQCRTLIAECRSPAPAE